MSIRCVSYVCFIFPFRTYQVYNSGYRRGKKFSSGIPRQRATADSTSEVALWGRLFDPASTELSPAAAQYILSLRFPQPDLDRMHALAEKARTGTLTLEEHIELDNYERVG